jgi:glutamate dehydrogenase (NAD(P)+)
VHHYVDPVEGFHGFLAFHGRRHRLAAGGLRVQAGLTSGMISQLAEVMAMKERLLGLSVDGAKAGIDYDPLSPGKREAVRRFLRFLRPHLEQRLSLGPDMGTRWSEIEGLARQEGLPSVKMAVARAQGLDPAQLSKRLTLLDMVVDGLTVGEQRAGHALAHVALAAAEQKGVDRPLRAVVHGFGTLGRGAALALDRAGAVVTGVSDEHGSLTEAHGLEVKALLEMPPGASVAHSAVRGTRSGRPQDSFAVDADLLVLASCEDSVTMEQALKLPVGVVAVGANLGLSPRVEQVLHDRGIVVVPDILGGCGGSASMDALFGPPTCPSPHELLERLRDRMRVLVARVLRLSTARGITTRRAVTALCEAELPAGARPYGRSAEIAAVR